MTDRTAKYGLWDSIHLFSGIIILSLAQIIDTAHPGSIAQTEQDTSLYAESKSLLAKLASVGNLAAKGHLRTLEDIETVLERVTQTHAQSQDWFDLDIFEWIDTLNSPAFPLNSAGALNI